MFLHKASIYVSAAFFFYCCDKAQKTRPRKPTFFSIPYLQEPMTYLHKVAIDDKLEKNNKVTVCERVRIFTYVFLAFDDTTCLTYCVSQKD